MEGEVGCVCVCVSNSFQDFTGSQRGERPIRQKYAFFSLILVLVSASAAAAAVVL